MKGKYKWVLIVTLLAFWISVLVSLLVTIALDNVTLSIAIMLTFLFILLGIIFDIIGVSVASSSDVAFHSMSARRVKIGRIGVMLIKNASKVSSICCDVVGDICGIITGITGVAIVTILSKTSKMEPLYISLIVTALISSLTIGGKALGKNLAISKGTEVITAVAKILAIFIKK